MITKDGKRFATQGPDGKFYGNDGSFVGNNFREIYSALNSEQQKQEMIDLGLGVASACAAVGSIYATGPLAMGLGATGLILDTASAISTEDPWQLAPSGAALAIPGKPGAVAGAIGSGINLMR